MFKKFILAFALVVVSAFSVSVAFAHEPQLSNTTEDTGKYWANIRKEYTKGKEPDEIDYDDGRGYIGKLKKGVGICYFDDCTWTYYGWMYYSY